MVYSNSTCILPSGKIVRVKHTSNGSSITLDNIEWDIFSGIPSEVENELIAADIYALEAVLDDAVFDYHTINQHQ